MRPLLTAHIALLLALLPPPARACAPAPPLGVEVQIADEDAVIVWDPAARTEHFIRRASFHTAATSNFGFLVPTPSQPALAEIPDRLVSDLEERIRPPIIQVRERAILPGLSCMYLQYLLLIRGENSGMAPAPVRVLREQRVAGYDAVVLEADNPRALAEWLAKNGYDRRPALAEWLAPYVAARWKITAFKIVHRGTPAAEHRLGTGLVRMTFTTDRPFFPYREPRDQREGATGDRLLRVFLVAPARMEGKLGEQGHPWPGKVLYAAPTDLPAVAGVAATRGWLTAFEDRGARQGDGEVFFSEAASQQEVRPKPVQWPVTDAVIVPLDLIALVGYIVYVVTRALRRRRR